MSEQQTQAFMPRVGGAATTASRTVSGTSASVALPLCVGVQQVRVLMVGATAVAFIRFGIATPTALVSVDLPIVNGVPELFTVPPHLMNAGTMYMAAIGTDGTIYVTPGEGI